MGRGCERFAAFFASGRCRRTEGCAGIEDGRAVRGFRRPGDEIQGTVNLYQALGGGRDITEEK